MWIHNLDPTLLTFGPFEIRYYGLVYVIGFLFVLFFLEYMRKKNKVPLNKEQIYDLIFYLILGVLIGSRLFHVIFWEPSYYLAQPWKILYFWQGGMSFHGGLLGVILVGLWFSKKNNIKFLQLADIISIPAVIILAFGRIANFINGELPGTPTESSWCVIFPGYEECRHPIQLYSALKRFLVAGVLVLINLNKHKPGFIFLNLIFFMGLGRFFIDFLREDARWLGLSAGQYFSLAMVLITTYIFLKYYKKECKKLFHL
ncbi:MAG: prolipoprotein diacylglyceryl transferase [archaeon]